MHRRPTAKQNAARARNWRIRCLRALAAQTTILTGDRQAAALAAVDAELALMGALTSNEHRERNY